MPAATAFQQLSGLVGTWRNADRPNAPLRIRFFLAVGDTVLVESCERAGEPHSLTLYHRDGETLFATHYCPPGNQPRLTLTPDVQTLTFIFRDATDLTDGDFHLHDLSFDVTDASRPIWGETYRRGSTAEDTILRLSREAPAPTRR